ncbi:IS66 family insertion sequence element accessory protein TnpB [Paenibacillus sp. GYB004]|uniref:IS66 family insertion sequence element accessory protein TnpA n=1 Tax=Paenibacillus sp. GYB004 TaxID=2994393 RepID=UPI002F963D7B
MTANEQLRQQWAARIAKYRASGLTLKAWCAAHDCTVHQMKYWLYKSKTRTPSDSTGSSTPAPATRFVPLTVAEQGKRASLVLRVGPAQIDLYAGFDPRLLREVVHALAEAVPC